MFDHHENEPLSKNDYDREFEKAMDMIYSTGLKLYNGNTADAADFVQSVYLFALKKFHLFEGRSAFSTWLYRLAWNFGLEDLRKKKRLNELDIADFDLPAAEISEEIDEGKVTQLRAEIKKLPEKYRLPLIMLYFEKMSYQEIQKMTGIREGTLKANVYRAKQWLHQALMRSSKISATPNRETQKIDSVQLKSQRKK